TAALSAGAETIEPRRMLRTSPGPWPALTRQDQHARGYTPQLAHLRPLRRREEGRPLRPDTDLLLSQLPRRSEIRTHPPRRTVRGGARRRPGEDAAAASRQHPPLPVLLRAHGQPAAQA